jgi:hypothetical protein
VPPLVIAHPLDAPARGVFVTSAGVPENDFHQLVPHDQGQSVGFGSREIVQCLVVGEPADLKPAGTSTQHTC